MVSQIECLANIYISYEEIVQFHQQPSSSCSYGRHSPYPHQEDLYQSPRMDPLPETMGSEFDTSYPMSVNGEAYRFRHY